jgi:hypothetical protein
LIAVTSLASVAVGDLQAQTTCIPPAVGVPFASGPPKWWDPAADPTPGQELYQRIDDPRWKGSLRIGDGGDGTVEHLAFRALHHTEGSAQSLYLSWWVRVAPIAASDDNVLYLGLGDGSDNLLLKVRLGSLDTQATQPPEENVEVFPVHPTSGGLGTMFADDPPWTDNIRVWAGDTPYPQNWAIHVNVPLNDDLGNNVELPDDTDFKLWYEILQGTPGDPVDVYTWPYSRGDDRSNQVKDFPPDLAGERPPAPTGWESFRVSSGGDDPDCPTGGVAIYPLDIGTTHPDGAGRISLNSPNTFYARPWNFTGNRKHVGLVHARFRIANWGSNPADPNISSGQLWMDARGLEDVTQNPPPDSIDDGSQWDVQGVWTLNQAERDLFQTGERWLHQCILVELSGPVSFTKSSVYRNMRFVDTSRFTEDAQISLSGLEPFEGGGPNRDVYLYVQATNMPKVAFPAWKADQEAAPATVTRSRPGEARALALAMVARDSLVDPDTPLHERLAMTQPTYMVHAYYDTGNRFTVNGVSRPVLQPMTSFGYFARHDGPVEGWKHLLSSPDVQLEEVGPNFYKLSVPNDGAVTVTNTIEAIEPKRFGISLHVGVSIPHGSFADAYDVGYGAAADLEYRLTSSLSVEAILGYHHFGSKTGGADQELAQAALNAKLYFSSGALRPYVFAGGGGYRFDPGSEEAGTNAGTGLQWNLSPAVALELDYTFHTAYTGGVTTTFSAIQAGGRVRF